MTRSVRPIPPETLEAIYRDDPLPAPSTPPSWFLIVPAWALGLAVIFLLWSERLF